MERTTISIPDHLLRRLRMIAAEERASMAAVIREALEEKVERYRPKPRSLGIGSSGVSDTARTAGERRLPVRSWR